MRRALLFWSLTKSRFPSTLAAMPRGVLPALTDPTTSSFAVSITESVPSFSFEA